MVQVSPPPSSTQNDVGNKGFTAVVAVCFTLNYIIGTGFLVLPWAFVQAGLVLSVVTILVASYLADVATDYVLEAMARAQCHNPASVRNEDSPLLSVTGDEIEMDVDTESAIEDGGGRSTSGNGKRKRTVQMSRSGLLMVGHDKLEMNTLCQRYLGRTGLLLYTIAISTYVFFLLWVYASVFALAMSLVFPLPSGYGQDWSYLFYVLIYSAIVIPMTFMDLEDQKGIQVALTGCRITRLALMIGTSALFGDAYFRGGAGATSGSIGYAADHVDANKHHNADIPYIRLAGFFQMVPIAVYATVFHQGIPDLAQPVMDKTRLSSIFRWALGITAMVYAGLGFFGAGRFGFGVNPSANLNWETFRCPEEGGSGCLAPWMYVVVSYFVVISPTLDVISGFPLNAITLSNNLMGAFGMESVVHEDSGSRKVLFRLISTVPALIGAALVSDLGVVTSYAGVFGIALAYVFPAILYLRSGRIGRIKGYPIDTLYTGPMSSEFWAMAIFWFGICMMILVLGQLTLSSRQ